LNDSDSDEEVNNELTTEEIIDAELQAYKLD